MKTSTGFEIKVDKRILTDYRLVRALVKAEKGTEIEKLDGASELIELIIGKDTDRFMEHIKKHNDGFVPMDSIMKEIGEILAEIKEAKN